MPTIIRNPAVEDYFVDITVKDARALPNGLIDLYEDGKIIWLRDYKPELDYAFLNAVDFTVRDTKLPKDLAKRLQKMQLKHFSARNFTGEFNEYQRYMIDAFFAGDEKKFLYFSEQANSAFDQFAKLRATLFPTYTFVNNVSLTYRFTETLFENLHWDSFVDYPDRHQVRIFCNVDNSPRLWCTSHQLYDYLDENYEQFGLDRYKDDNPNAVIQCLDREVLGGLRARCLDTLPRHHIAFDQGDVWFADSRAISHQIYYGRRAIIYAMEVDLDTMADPAKRFNGRIAALHDRHRKPKAGGRTRKALTPAE